MPFGAFASDGDSPKQGEKLNVLFLMVDDMNGYGVLEQYPDIITPNIHKFRDQCVNFVASSCASPVSVPSRTSFFSGLYPHTTGAYLNSCDGWRRNPALADPEQVESMPECFKRNGYQTWGRGKIFHSALTEGRELAMFDNRPIYQGGFGPFNDEDPYLGGSRFFQIHRWADDKDSEHPDNLNTEAAMEFFAEEHSKPFMMCLGLWKPHNPYTSPERFFNLYNDIDLPLPEGIKAKDLEDVPFLGRQLVDSLKKFKYRETAETEGVWRQFIEGYCANYSFADWNIGRVLDALDNSEYADNTLIVFCSDNGFHCGEKMRWGKGALWEQSAYAPMMFRLPKAMRESGDFEALKGVQCDTPVGLIDIYPTLVDLCGLDTPVQELDGESLRSLLADPNMKSDRVSVTSYGERYSSVRDVRYRLITYPDGEQELYDLKKDPYEWQNLAGEKKYRKVVERLEQHIPSEWEPTLGGRLEVPRK